MSILLSQVALAEDIDYAKKLANYNDDIGDNNGSQWITNFEPTIPFAIGENWNVISRTSLPVITQEDISSNKVEESGIGDIFQHLFLSPSKPTIFHNFFWGAGPVMLLNTASNDALGSNKGRWARSCSAYTRGAMDYWNFNKPYLVFCW